MFLLRPAGKRQLEFSKPGQPRSYLTISLSFLFLVTIYVLAGALQEVLAAVSGSQTEKGLCENTAQGPFLVTDDRGFVCRRSQLDHHTGCCVVDSSVEEQYSCSSCNTSQKVQCCKSYEYCVSCCMAPSVAARIRDTVEKSADRILLQSVHSPFVFCRNLCRTSSDSVVGENSYRSELKYCYGSEPSPSGLSLLIAEKEKQRTSLIEPAGAAQVAHATRRPAPQSDFSEGGSAAHKAHVDLGAINASPERSSRTFGSDFLHYLVANDAASLHSDWVVLLTLLLATAVWQFIVIDGLRSGP